MLLVLRATALTLDVVEVMLAAGELVPRAFDEDEEGFSKVGQYVEMVCGEEVRDRMEAEMISKHGASFKGFYSPKQLRAEGRAAGDLAARRALLLQLLRTQHGTLEPEAVARIETGSSEDLASWFERGAQGLPLAQVFGE